MTKQEAMAFAISVGKPIRHNSFSKGEFVRYKGKELVDEEGTILPQQKFWAIRSGGSWESGWEEYMTIEKLLEKAREFEKKNKSFTWKPHDFPEEMSESNTLDELVSEGDSMYDALKEAVELISDLADELEYKIEVEG